MGSSVRLTRARHSSRKSSATHSYQCMQCFRVQTMVWLPVLGIFNVHTDADVDHGTTYTYNDVVHGTNTLKGDCTGKFDSLGEKSLAAAPGTRTRVSIAPVFSVGRSAK